VVVLQFCCVHTIESRLATLREIGAVQFQVVTKGGKGSDFALVLAVAAWAASAIAHSTTTHNMISFAIQERAVFAHQRSHYAAAQVETGGKGLQVCQARDLNKRHAQLA
jgi:hypothetical protein